MAFGRAIGGADATTVHPTSGNDPKSAVGRTAPNIGHVQPMAMGADHDADIEDYFAIVEETRASLVEMVDATRLQKLNKADARSEIAALCREILALKRNGLSNGMADRVVAGLIDDVLGYGPIEPLLARDDITDIMVNGCRNVFIESKGKITRANIRFRDNQHILNICQRIVSQIGRRVDESSPICDARLPDGSRVNVIVPPLAIDGPTLTIRKFRKERLRLDDYVRFGSIDEEGAELLRLIGRIRCNVLVSGGTGSGKTTLLNCLTAFIDTDERVVTCEDAAELQLQQPHVVRLETRPPNLEGEGAIEMRDLVKNCLRMRPDRIVVGEVRGGEAFDLLQAMNTGHDGSMGTVHANSPREALRRLETMITGAGYNLPARNIREMIANSVEVIIQTARLRDGRRVVTHVTEVVGMEQDVITTQDLYLYDITGESDAGQITGYHHGTGIVQPAFWKRAVYFGEIDRLTATLNRASTRKETVS